MDFYAKKRIIKPLVEEKDVEVIFLLAIYFVPTIIAVVRDHRQTVPIVVVNVVLGWLLIPWFIALIWSINYQEKRDAT